MRLSRDESIGGRLNVTYLEFDLVILAAKNVNETILSPPAEVASVVHHGTAQIGLAVCHSCGYYAMNLPVIGEAVKLVLLSSHFGKTNVSTCGTMTTSPHNTTFANRNRVLVLVKNVDGIVGGRAADGQWSTGDVFMHSVNNSGLSGAAAVVIDAIGGPFIGKPEKVGDNLWLAVLMLSALLGICYRVNSLLRAWLTGCRSHPNVWVGLRVMFGQYTRSADEYVDLESRRRRILAGCKGRRL